MRLRRLSRGACFGACDAIGGRTREALLYSLMIESASRGKQTLKNPAPVLSGRWLLWLERTALNLPDGCENPALA